MTMSVLNHFNAVHSSVGAKRTLNSSSVEEFYTIMSGLVHQNSSSVHLDKKNTGGDFGGDRMEAGTFFNYSKTVKQDDHTLNKRHHQQNHFIPPVSPTLIKSAVSHTKYTMVHMNVESYLRIESYCTNKLKVNIQYVC